MTALAIALAIALGLAALVAAVAYAAFRMAFYSDGRKRVRLGDLPGGGQYGLYKERVDALRAELAALPYESVSITSRDGLRLAGKYFHAADGAPLVIMFHGYCGVAERDYCGGHKLCRESGLNTLLVDQRAHGASEGRVITFGVKERYDCLDWANYAADRFGAGVRIILSGISMGAATVMMASDLPLPANVVGIMADCGYSSPGGIIREVVRTMRLPVSAAYPFVRLGARLFGRFDLEESSSVSSLSRARVPVLIIHGEEDRFVPCSMAAENYAACASEKRLLTVPGAGHGLSFFVGMPAYAEACREFVGRALAGAP